jgi:tryptophan synthase alpha subunit
MKNITLSADGNAIEVARKKALEENTSLQNLFRQWLSEYIANKNISNDLDMFLNTTSASTERSFFRDELNER